MMALKFDIDKAGSSGSCLFLSFNKMIPVSARSPSWNFVKISPRFRTGRASAKPVAMVISKRERDIIGLLRRHLVLTFKFWEGKENVFWEIKRNSLRM